MTLGTRSLLGAAAVLLAIGNLGRIPFINIGGRAGAISLLDLLLVPLWLLLALKIWSGARHWRFDAVSRALLLFVAVATLSTLLAAPKWGLGVGAWLSTAAFLVRWVLYAGFFLLVVTDPDPEQESATGWAYFERAVLVVAGFGIFQVAVLPEFGVRMFEITGIPADPQGRRLVSSFLDPQLTGGLLALALLFRVARVAEGLPYRVVPLALLAVALVLTLSRSAILGFAAGVAVLLWVRGFSPALRRLGVYGGLIALPLMPPVLVFAAEFNKLGVDGSALQRLIPWLRSLALVKDNLWFGVGFNATSHAQAAYGWTAVGGSDVSMDGGLLFVTVMTGVLGLGAFLLLLAAVWRVARRSWRAPQQRPETRAFALGTVAATVAIVLQSFFTNTLLSPWLLLPLWVAWARVVVTAPPSPIRAKRASRAPGRVLAIGPAALALVLLAGCEPCAGLANCSTSEQRVLTGTIVSRQSEAPLLGVPVEAEGRVSVTNAQGRWRLVLPAGADSITLQVGGDSGYTVHQGGVRAVRVTGDGTELGVWYDKPAFSYIMGLLYRDALLPSTTTRFEVDPSEGGGVVASSEVAAGYVRLFGPAPKAGPVRGSLVVEHPTLGTRVFEEVLISADYASRVGSIREWFKLDGRYPYGGNVVDRGTFEVSAGATVMFTRTGGRALTQNPVVVTTDATGFFLFELEPLGRGAIIGDLTFTPANGRPSYTYSDFRLTTFDSTTARYIGLFAHGERWDWVVEVRRAADSSAVTWTPFEFVRTAGLAIEPGDTVTGSSNGSGRLLIRASTRDTGSVTGVLTMRPVGAAPVPVGTFTLRTFAADTQNFAGLRYVAWP